MTSKRAVAFDRRFGRRFYRIHRRMYRLTGGIIGHHSGTGTMLLLTTTGRVSGEPRTTPLLYMADGEDFLVVGSNGGREEAPQWVRNLQATPKAVVQAGRRRHRVVARFASDDEAAELWPKLSAYYHGWDYYKTLTDRDLPVVAFRKDTSPTSG